MRPPGAFKIAHRTRFDREADPPTGTELCLGSLLGGGGRSQRILDSLRNQILEGGEGRNVSIRRVFQTPREIYRLELQLPEFGYQRITLLDRDALEELLEADDVRDIIGTSLGW